MIFKNAFGAEFREVGERDYLGKPARVLVASRVYPTSQDDLWDAITNKERLPRWFAPIEGDLKLGGHYKIKDNAEGKITRCDPPEAIDLTWEYSSNVSWVRVRLTPENEAARLTLEHIMSKDPEAERHWREYGPGATGIGWDFGFYDLGLYLASKGGSIDRSAYEAWLQTEDGQAFIRSCATAWGEAHIKSGEAPDTAKAIAERTANFYCGT